MTKREIEKLGQSGGRSDVDEFHGLLCREPNDDGDYLDDAEICEKLLATIASSHLSWDDAARNADAAFFNKVRGAKNVERYYTAYTRAAVARVHELAA